MNTYPQTHQVVYIKYVQVFFLTSHLNKMFFFNLFLTKALIALQYYVGVCHTATRISHRCTYVPPS